MGMFSSLIKDPLLSKALNTIFALYISDFGKVSSLKIDTNSKVIFLILDLEGETEQVTLNITKYEIIERDGQYYFIVREFNSSKRWLEIAVKKYALNLLQYPIPVEYASIVKKLV